MLLAGLAIGSAFLWVTLSQIQLSEVGRVLFEDARPGLAIPFLAIYVAFFWLKAVRWRLLLTPLTAVAARQLLPSIVIGYASNLLLPAQLGEVVRTYVLGKTMDVGNAPILATIVLERMFDFLAVLLLLALVMVSGDGQIAPTLKTAGYLVGGAAFTLLAVMLVVLFRMEWFVAVFRRMARVLPTRATESALVRIEGAARGFQSIRNPWLLARIAFASIVMWAIMAVGVYISLLALRIDTAFSAAVVALVFTVIGFALPAIPGYVGTIQLSFLLALRPYGIAPEPAVAASIYYHALITVPPLLAAGYFAARLGFSSLVSGARRR